MCSGPTYNYYTSLPNFLVEGQKYILWRTPQEKNRRILKIGAISSRISHQQDLYYRNRGLTQQRIRPRN